MAARGCQRTLAHGYQHPPRAQGSLVSRRLQILESNAVSDARIGGVAIYRELFGAGLAGQKVALALSQVIAERGAPVSITVDNGIEFASKAMEAWAARRRY